MPSNKLTSVDNWELFPHQSFRFYLPGKIGLGWHDTVSLSLMPTTMGESDGTEMECSVQDCPILLRKGVSELFPETDPDKSPMTIVTLSQKAQQEDQDLEKLTKEFTLVAQETCYKLKLAGYWADFINPFSGLPFFSPFKGNKLYKTDVRRQCRQFNILLTGSCRIISDKEAEKFSGKNCIFEV
ncbi:hypothetical protein AAG570_004181 [Ranatra chinensis]|uniref:Uncharacterized protein n=1 Tax=Ranatra chinensis TaxID=642074 RepID=A0ABD0YHJ7_9HEMI